MLVGPQPGAAHAQLLGDVEAGRQRILMEAVAAIAAAEVGVAAKVVEEISGDRAPHDVGVIGIVAFQCCDHEILQTFALEDPPDVRETKLA